jgi:acylphosphatase
MDKLAETAQVRLQIRGRVQGVYFRASTVQQAQWLGLTGWVMNCDDGSVEAIVEGSRERLEKMIAWCWQGPAGARVTHVDVEWSPAQDSFHGFSIKR